jgi:hypothetical protein
VNTILSKIRTYGALGYSYERIADLLGLKEEERLLLLLRLNLPGDEYHNAYKNGFAVGEWNVDAELAKQAEKGDIDAIKALAERSKERSRRDLKQKLFGL